MAPITQFQVETPNADAQVTVTREGERTIIDVVSERGIGEATITLVSGPKPASMTVRLHLDGLEQFTVRYGETEIMLAVPSAGDLPSFQSVRQAASTSGDEEMIAADSPFWMETTVSDDDPRFEVELPRDFLDGPETTLTIHWIDFFRG
jgi:hypothetical protein